MLTPARVLRNSFQGTVSIFLSTFVFSGHLIRWLHLFCCRIQVADAEYKTAFDDELRAFKERIRKRADEKLQEAIKEQEEEERKERLGPGGLDPVEVFESLPVVSHIYLPHKALSHFVL